MFFVFGDLDTRTGQIKYVSTSGQAYTNVANHVCQYFGTGIQTLCIFSISGYTRVCTGARRTNRRISVHRAGLWLLFTDMADETPTRRERHSRNPAVPFLVAISIKTPYMKKFKGSPLCPVGRIANLPLGPANCTMPPFAYQHPSNPKIQKLRKHFVCSATDSER